MADSTAGTGFAESPMENTRVKENRMLKRYGWLLLVLSIAAPLAGCGYVAAGAAGAAVEHQADQHDDDAD
jgi:hypothetical protein